jgi:hypothetical protein
MVSIYAEIDDTLEFLIADYLEKHPELSYSELIEEALSAFLLLPTLSNGEG